MAGYFSLKMFAEKAIVIFVCLSFFALSIGTVPLTICSLAAFALWILSGACFRDRGDWIGQDWLVPVILVMALPWLAILWSPSSVAAVSFAIRSHYWLFSLVAASSIKTERSLRQVLICFITGMVVTSLPILLYSFSLLPDMYFVSGIITKGYITYSLLVVVSIVLLAFFYKNSSNLIHKVLFVALIILMALTITRLSGRSGYLALMLLSPWIFFTMFGRRRVIPVLGALVLVFALMFTSQKVQERVARIPQEIKLYQSGYRSVNSAVGVRLEMWHAAWNIFINNPLAGAGTGGYQFETTKSRLGHGFSHPHNSYLYIAANYGIMGIMLYGWLFVVTLKRAWKARCQLSGYSMLAFLSVIMIGSLTDTAILSVATGTVLGFIIGIPTAPPTECVSS